MAKKKAFVDKNVCVACGVCTKVCPKQVIEIINGCYAKMDEFKKVSLWISLLFSRNVREYDFSNLSRWRRR